MDLSSLSLSLSLSPSPSPSPSSTAASVSEVYARTVSGPELVGTAVLNLVLGVVLLLAFEGLRRMFPRVYASRKTEESEYRERSPPLPPPTLLSWVGAVRSLNNVEFLGLVGLDAYVLDRFTKVCLRFCVFGSVVGMGVIVPLYAATGDEGLTDFERLTLRNLSNDTNDQRMWGAVAFTYIALVYFLYLLRDEFIIFIKLRNNFLVRGDENLVLQSRYSVLLENIPQEYRTNKALMEFFHHLFPGTVHSAVVLHALQPLEALVRERGMTVNRLEHALLYRQVKGKPLRVMARAGWTWSKVDAIDHYSKQVAELNERISKMQARYHTSASNQDEAVMRQLGAIKLLGRLAFMHGATLKPRQGSEASKEGDWDAHAANTPREEGGHEAEAAANKGAGFEELEAEAVQEPTPASERFAARLQERAGWLLGSQGSSSQPDTAVLISPVDLRSDAQPVNLVGAQLAGLTKEALDSAAILGDATLHVTEGISGAFGLLTSAHEDRASTGFITFTTQVACSMACQMLLNRRPGTFTASHAPEPRDILWHNATKPPRQIAYRANLVLLVSAVGVLLWNSVIAVIVAIGNLDSLAQYIPVIRKIPSDSLAYKIASGYLSVLLLLAVLNALPFIFAALALNYEGYKTMSRVHRTVCRRYFLFLVANVYVVIAAQSFWSIVGMIPHDPQSALLQFGAKLPAAACYCTQLVVVKAFAALPAELLRVGSLFQALVGSLTQDRALTTMRERIEAVHDLSAPTPELTYPAMLLVFLLCAAYHVLSPVILPVGAIYFWSASLVQRYQALYVFVPRYESGGLFWYILFARVLVSLVCGQLLLISYLLARGRLHHAVVLMPLPLVVAWFYRFCMREYGHHSRQLSLDFAVSIDHEEARQGGGRSYVAGFRDELYMQPALVVGPVDVSGLSPKRTTPQQGGAGDDNAEVWL